MRLGTEGCLDEAPGRLSRGLQPEWIPRVWLGGQIWRISVEQREEVMVKMQVSTDELASFRCPLQPPCADLPPPKKRGLGAFGPQS